MNIHCSVIARSCMSVSTFYFSLAPCDWLQSKLTQLWDLETLNVAEGFNSIPSTEKIDLIPPPHTCMPKSRLKLVAHNLSPFFQFCSEWEKMAYLDHRKKDRWKCLFHLFLHRLRTFVYIEPESDLFEERECPSQHLSSSFAVNDSSLTISYLSYCKPICHWNTLHLSECSRRRCTSCPHTLRSKPQI